MASSWALAKACDHLFGDNLPSGAEPHIERLATLLDEARQHGFEAGLKEGKIVSGQVCPTCPTMQGALGTFNFSTFGPCGDGKYHDTRCPIARKEMVEARWPCGKLRYPELSPR